jgi:hypothetical protein
VFLLTNLEFAAVAILPNADKFGMCPGAKFGLSSQLTVCSGLERVTSRIFKIFCHDVINCVGSPSLVLLQDSIYCEMTQWTLVRFVLSEERRG